MTTDILVLGSLRSGLIDWMAGSFQLLTLPR